MIVIKWLYFSLVSIKNECFFLVGIFVRAGLSISSCFWNAQGNEPIFSHLFIIILIIFRVYLVFVYDSGNVAVAILIWMQALKKHAPGTIIGIVSSNVRDNIIQVRGSMKQELHCAKCKCNHECIFVLTSCRKSFKFAGIDDISKFLDVFVGKILKEQLAWKMLFFFLSLIWITCISLIWQV